MKKFAAFILIMASLLTACSFNKFSPLEYNNAVVKQFSEHTKIIEQSKNQYGESIPNVVTEQDEIDTSKMQATYDALILEAAKSDALLFLESKDEAQQIAVRAGLETYIRAAQLYLESYNEILDYYSSEAYQSDITQVQNLDERLHMHYATFIEANNDLAETAKLFLEE
jgi:hypothetical protein